MAEANREAMRNELERERDDIMRAIGFWKNQPSSPISDGVGAWHFVRSEHIESLQTILNEINRGLAILQD